MSLGRGIESPGGRGAFPAALEKLWLVTDMRSGTAPKSGSPHI
jgi:hypothetical protein